MAEFTRLATQVPGLDELLAGGLPKGRAVLLAGRSGTGKTLMSLQIACNLARQGHKTVFVSVEERPDDLLSITRDLGFEPEALLESGDLQIIDLVQPLAGPVLLSGNFDIAGLIHRLSHLIESHESEVLVLDSVTALFAAIPETPHLRHQFFQLTYALTSRDQTAILTAEAPSDYGQIANLGLEDFVCDVVLQLRNVIDGKRRRRSVEVHKYRRSPHLKGEYPLAITKRGLSVFPLDAASEELREGSEEVRRYSSGVTGLDEMTNGGWLRDSILLVRGPTGSGKTILAGSLAAAGAERGERVFYYGFEETRTLLVRNFERLGLPIRRHLDAGNLKITARFPESTSPEDMIIELRTVLTEHEPSLIVLDSISAIEHVISYESFRQFMIGVTSALRQHGRSALLTQAVSSDHKVDDAAPYLSTMADAILQLSYDLSSPDAFNRGVRILKMRGSAHDTRGRQLELSAEGMRIDAGAGTRQ